MGASSRTTIFDQIDGRRQFLVGKIQEHYGNAREEAEKQADEFVRSLKSEEAGENRARGTAH